MKAMTAIKTYFGMTAAQAAKECKALSHEDRQELGALACVELGVEFVPTPAPTK